MRLCAVWIQSSQTDRDREAKSEIEKGGLQIKSIGGNLKSEMETERERESRREKIIKSSSKEG